MLPSMQLAAHASSGLLKLHGLERRVRHVCGGLTRIEHIQHATRSGAAQSRVGGAGSSFSAHMCAWHLSAPDQMCWEATCGAPVQWIVATCRQSPQVPPQAAQPQHPSHSQWRHSCHPQEAGRHSGVACERCLLISDHHASMIPLSTARWGPCRAAKTARNLPQTRRRMSLRGSASSTVIPCWVRVCTGAFAAPAAAKAYPVLIQISTLHCPLVARHKTHIWACPIGAFRAPCLLQEGDMNIGSLKLPGKNGSSAWLHMQSGLLGALACSFIEQGQDIKREESQSQSTRLRCHTSRAVARLPVRQRHLRRCKGSKKGRRD